jgi:hypothetical protein
MVKNDLHEQGYSVTEKFPKTFIVNILWAIIALSMIAGTFILLMSSIGYVNWTQGSNNPIPVTSSGDEIMVYILEILGMFILYFALKLVMTILFCSDKHHSIRLTILEGRGMPICECREALKVWQIVLIYLVPVIIIYGAMYGICAYKVYVKMEYGFFFMLLFMSFFLAFDLALVIYVLAIKIKEKVNYISIDYHIYEMTLFKETYVKFSNNSNKKTKELYNKESRSFEKPVSKKIFTRTMTCGNLQCENYGTELPENTEICPSCGEKTGKFALVFSNTRTCINPQCENYGYELKDNADECLLCGAPSGRLAFKIKNHLAAPAIIIAISSIVIYNLFNWFAFDIAGNVIDIINIIKLVISIISISMGIASKSKRAVIISIMALIFNSIFAFIFLNVVI